MGNSISMRRIVSVLLLVVAFLMLLWHLLPVMGWAEASFPMIIQVIFAGILLFGAWLLWRDFAPTELSYETSAVGSSSGLHSEDSDGDLDAKLAARDADLAAQRAEIAALKAALADSTAQEASAEADNTSDSKAIWTSSPTLAGKSQQDLNTMFGGGFVDGGLCRHFKIDYTDSKGKTSEREILVYAMVHRRGYINLDSFPMDAATCLTFRADRINRLEDVQSGEIVSENIQEYLLDGREIPGQLPG